METSHHQRNFVADETVGKLAKWLRILGYDTCYDPGLTKRKTAWEDAEGRILLTRSRYRYQGVPDNKILRLQSDNAMQQLVEVVTTLDLGHEPLAPCKRCLRCNTRIVMVSKESVCGSVPDYVWTTQTEFYRCERCRRIYWRGTHYLRIMATLAAIVPGQKVMNERKP